MRAIGDKDEDFRAETKARHRRGIRRDNTSDSDPPRSKRARTRTSTSTLEQKLDKLLDLATTYINRQMNQ